MKTLCVKLSSSIKSLKAFTLVEALMTVFIFSIISGVSLMILMSSSDSWQTNSVRLELHQELRKATDWMNQDLFPAGISTITNVPADGSWYDTITFKTGGGVSGGNPTWSSETIQFVLGGSSSNQLQRISGGQTRIIAQDIQSLQFRRQSTTPNIVEVSLQAQKDTTRGATIIVNSSSEVRLRN